MPNIYKGGDDDQREGKVAVELLSRQERVGNADQNNGRRIPSAKRGVLSNFQRMSLWKRILMSALCLALIIVIIMFIVVLIRTATVGPPKQSKILEKLLSTEAKMVDDGKEMVRAKRLAGALKIKTVSTQNPKPGDDKAFFDLLDYLKRQFPNVHRANFVKRDVVNEKSLLYTVTGTVAGKLPYMLASHIDVVPASPSFWEVDPYGGEIINDTYIYGRGALDDKTGVLGILEALEYMIESGEKPKRSFYLAFGHDEETSGKNGALMIAKELTKRGVTKLDFILDEGHPITHNLFPGTDKNVALIGVSEKGALTIELSVTKEPGHSSFPPWESALVTLADAVSRLEKNKLPIVFGDGPERYTFEYLVPHVSFGFRLLFSNLWLFGSSIAGSMEEDPQTNAMVRTTTAVTIFNSGDKMNTVPGFANATVNHRVHPSQTIEQILEFDKKTINNKDITVKIYNTRIPHPTSPFGAEDAAYQTVVASVTQTFPNTISVPGLMIANTDMTSYLNFTSNIYRFLPAVLEPQDLARYHGHNERISVSDYAKAVSFYYRIIQNSDLLVEEAPDL